MATSPPPCRRGDERDGRRQAFRFPDDPRFDPRLHQLSPQQQSQILEDIRQHHRFHQQQLQLQPQLQAAPPQPQHRPLRPRPPRPEYTQQLHRPGGALRPESHQEQFNVIPRQPPPFRFQQTDVEQPNAFKITLSADKPTVNFLPPPGSAGLGPVQPVLFVQQPQLEDAALLTFPQHFGSGVSLAEQPLREQPLREQPLREQPLREQPHREQPHREQPLREQPLREQPLREQPLREQPLREQPLREQAYRQPPKHDSLFINPAPVAARPSAPKEHEPTRYSSAEYAKENAIATSSQNYFAQSFNNHQNKQPNKIDPLLSGHQTTPDYFEPAVTPFPPSRTQPPRSEVIHDLPVIPVTRPQIVTEAPTAPKVHSSTPGKPLYFGDRKQPKLSPTPLPTLPKIKFPKELEEEYSLVSVKHLNEAVSEAEQARSTERPRNAKIRLENHLLQYGQSQGEADGVPTTTSDYSSAIHLQEDRKQLLDQITKAHQSEQSTRPPRPRKTTKPPKEIIEITYQQKPSTQRPVTKSTPKLKTDDIVHPPDLQEQLLKQLQEQFSQRKDLIQQLKLDPEAGVLPSNILTSSDLLPKNATGPIITSGGQKYQVIQLPAKEAQALLAKQKAGAALKTTPSPTTTPKPPKKVLDELTKGVIPHGADFEIIRKTEDGRLEPVRGVPSSLPDKKVTFVLLEEQQDGSYKVQGVRGNEASKENGGEEVDSILKKIKAGEIELPPPSRDNSVAKRTTVAPPVRSSSSADSVASPSSPTYGPTTTASTPTTSYSDPVTSNIKVYVNSGSGDLSSPNNIYSTPAPNDYPFSSSTARPTYSSVPTSPAPPSTVYDMYSPTVSNSSDYVTAGQAYYNTDAVPATHSSPRPNSYFTEPTTNPEANWQVSASSSPSYPSPSPAPSSSPSPAPSPAPSNYYSPTSQFLPTVTPIPDNALPSSTADPGPGPGPYSVEPQLRQKDLYSVDPQIRQKDLYSPETHVPSYPDPTSSYYDRDSDEPSDKNHRSLYSGPPVNHKYTNVSAIRVADRAPDSLIDVLKRNGLHAMARFLRQSGLDSILNDTGPYTVFIPTDRAFKTLLVQLGGPDRAEEKFRENPRLLSGLLLHHVIPGAFRLASLQDEMTGVSLAGTQLRVNTYTTQDDEWNDVQVVTINGAQVLQELSDLSIPQGVAHAVDRVMFPLPVGDLVQTMTADKDRRFGTFLRAVRASGLADMLTGSKTYTVFAPTERAFQGLKDAELARLTSERAGARALVLKHIMPTTFYSAGMRYFQVRESMARGKQITIVNEDGRIKANAALIVTHNIPATNGVVHAIDTLL
ncbi:Transforming growth factor-beta-induced protein ig-h3 [Frankliniella fusca]|uniref:Transforming growth factor-beta-induced protein ig-h3 n=1 Tax=Frankliniella fusca TaxID=407009 RepID=A0AAE1HPM0_9NEOP|nr:Transforming growth factor-beta-induced protein ig-h3 [Frankliniella fusca]